MLLGNNFGDKQLYKIIPDFMEVGHNMEVSFNTLSYNKYIKYWTYFCDTDTLNVNKN